MGKHVLVIVGPGQVSRQEPVRVHQVRVRARHLDEVGHQGDGPRLHGEGEGRLGPVVPQIRVDIQVAHEEAYELDATLRGRIVHREVTLVVPPVVGRHLHDRLHELLHHDPVAGIIQRQRAEGVCRVPSFAIRHRKGLRKVPQELLHLLPLMCFDGVGHARPPLPVHGTRVDTPLENHLQRVFVKGERLGHHCAVQQRSPHVVQIRVAVLHGHQAVHEVAHVGRHGDVYRRVRRQRERQLAPLAHTGLLESHVLVHPHSPVVEVIVLRNVWREQLILLKKLFSQLPGRQSHVHLERLGLSVRATIVIDNLDDCLLPERHRNVPRHSRLPRRHWPD
mmetsp:Transcript_4464/g.12506  ORF Transcript_4464/g.12506 Transcript_4464/m.12506 type:complete len:335 (-) Transcript_4464:174-1178(-)